MTGTTRSVWREEEPGTFNTATRVYTAPATAGTATLQVNDGTGASVQSLLYMEDKTGPDYMVALAPATTFPAPGAGGAAFTGSFKIENISSQAGADAPSWQVFISRDGALDSLSRLVQNGTLVAALGASSVFELYSVFGHLALRHGKLLHHHRRDRGRRRESGQQPDDQPRDRGHGVRVAGV